MEGRGRGLFGEKGEIVVHPGKLDHGETEVPNNI
jgi:hypothetical protein